MAAAKVGIEIEEGGTPLNTVQIERLLNHYAPSFSSETIALAKQLDSRGGDVLLLWTYGSLSVCKMGFLWIWMYMT